MPARFVAPADCALLTACAIAARSQSRADLREPGRATALASGHAGWEGSARRMDNTGLSSTTQKYQAGATQIRPGRSQARECDKLS